jgi:hypothetical protein
MNAAVTQFGPKWGRGAYELFFRSSGICLLLTAGAKIYSAMGHAGILQVPDPVLFFLTNRFLLAYVAIVELGIAFLALGRSSRLAKAAALFWLGCAFAAYRIAIWHLKPGATCPCLGTLTARMPLKPTTIKSLLEAFDAYLLLGSGSFLVTGFAWRRSRRPQGREGGGRDDGAVACLGM